MFTGFESLLRSTLQLGASDLHLMPGAPPVVRAHGNLAPLANSEPLSADDITAIFEAVVPDPGTREQFRAERDLDFGFTAPGLVAIRGNACIQRGAIKLSLRLLPLKVPSIKDLDLPPVMEELAGRPGGLVLACGPTGSGKSTTLAAMVQHINLHHKRVIVAVEDPIEFHYKNEQSYIIQREVGPDTKGFAAALRRALRQDPDVILVGEMRDLETISLAVTAAETGHLVLSTLHANSAVEAIDRVVDVFPPSQQAQIRLQLSMSLAGVVYQVLVPRADGKGRIAGCEVLIATTAIRNLIRRGSTQEMLSYLQMGKDVGMQTLEQSLEELKRKQLIRGGQAAGYGKTFSRYEDTTPLTATKGLPQRDRSLAAAAA